MQTREGSRGTGTLPVASSDEHNSSTSYRKCLFTGFIRSIYVWLLPYSYWYSQSILRTTNLQIRAQKDLKELPYTLTSEFSLVLEL